MKYNPKQPLRLDNNLVSDLYPLKNLSRLSTLEISNNRISDIKPLENLTALTVLDLGNNSVNDITSLINLNNLDKVDLYKNQITEFPKWILEKNLEVSWNRNNYPSSGINLLGNPIQNIPIEILKKGNDSISRYLDRISKEEKDFIYEAKLIFVGEGSAGKTSLQKRLVNSVAALPKKDKRTRGIEISDWIFKREKEKKHVAHIWDFGGQDVYYPVHRFFITENSVFVLLASTRQTHHNFDYWIPTIYQFGGSSPVIIGQTCHEGNRVAWNDLGSYVSNCNFNIIKTQELPYHEINLPQKNYGLDKLKSVIESQIINLPHYGKGVPKSWVRIRAILSTMVRTTPCITFETFENVCKADSADFFIKLSDITDCCQFLHDIGVVLWYSKNEELKNWVILEPEWAMNAVYKIIDDSEIQLNNGNIKSIDFVRLWDDKSYIGKHLILKKMLETFKIAFPKKHPQKDYIIPARLLSISNEMKWKKDNLSLHVEYEYEFMPRGLVNQVSAELSRYIYKEEEVWNNAVNFYLEKQLAKCQILEDFYNRKITINANGKDARSLITLVMHTLNGINEAYKGVKADINVPCTCPQCVLEEKPTMFPYSRLIDWATKKESVVCNESNERIQISTLLYNVGLSLNVTSNQNNSMTKTVTIFLASSSELVDDRRDFEIFINRENKRLNKLGIFLNLEIWEDFIDSMSTSTLQDEYNKVVRQSDIFVSLFFTKVGKYTEEEFEIAFGTFKSSGKPKIYTYFKEAEINIGKLSQDVLSRFQFQEKLKSLGHFPTVYKNIEDLQYKFKMQLDKVLANP